MRSQRASQAASAIEPVHGHRRVFSGPMTRAARAGRRSGAVFLLAALLAAPVHAQGGLQGAWMDAADDADGTPARDLVRLSWSLGQDASLTLRAAGNVTDGATFQAVVFVGSPGNVEPVEWYVVRADAASAIATAGHTDPPQELAATATAAGGTLTVSWPRTSPGGASCAVAVAHSIVQESGGRRVVDAVPDGEADLASAWRAGALCGQSPVPEPEDEGSPSAAAWLLGVALVTAAWRTRRRPQP